MQSSLKNWKPCKICGYQYPEDHYMFTIESPFDEPELVGHDICYDCRRGLVKNKSKYERWLYRYTHYEEWQEQEKAGLKERGKVYREKNKDKEKERKHKWYLENKNIVKARMHRRAARQRELPNSFSGQDWERCLSYFNHSCAYCGRHQGLWHFIAADHFIPLNDSCSPGTVPENIVPACHGIDGCNNSKWAKNPHEWILDKFGKKHGIKIIGRIQAYFKWVEEQKDVR